MGSEFLLHSDVPGPTHDLGLHLAGTQRGPVQGDQVEVLEVVTHRVALDVTGAVGMTSPSMSISG